VQSRLSKKITRSYAKRGTHTNGKRAKPARAVWYDIPYPASAYTFPKHARIKTARFDRNSIHLDLTDRRVLSIPLRWIPSLYHAAPKERAKFEISCDHRILIWDPAKCAIDDEIRLDDYFGSISPCETDI
jgi:hypothetical protein